MTRPAQRIPGPAVPRWFTAVWLWWPWRRWYVTQELTVAYGPLPTAPAPVVFVGFWWSGRAARDAADRLTVASMASGAELAADPRRRAEFWVARKLRPYRVPSPDMVTRRPR